MYWHILLINLNLHNFILPTTEAFKKSHSLIFWNFGPVSHLYWGCLLSSDSVRALKRSGQVIHACHSVKYYLEGGKNPSPEGFPFTIHAVPVSRSPGPLRGFDCGMSCVNEAPLEMKGSEGFAFLPLVFLMPEWGINYFWLLAATLNFFISLTTYLKQLTEIIFHVSS